MSTATNTFGPYRLDEMLGEGGSTGGRPAGRRRGPDRGPRSAVHPTAGPRTCTAEPPVRHGRRLLPIGVVLAVVALLVATWGLTSRAGPPLDAGLTATIDQRSLLGEVTAAGTVRPFAAQVATGVGGLFQSRRTVEGITTRIGWIVLPDGTQVGVRRSNDERGPAPPLDPVTLRASEDGHPIPVERVSGASVVLGS